LESFFRSQTPVSNANGFVAFGSGSSIRGAASARCPEASF
jgi:hypothetical protein